MVIFLKPKDIPSVINYIAKFWKKINSFIYEIQLKIKEITSEIDISKDEIEETFHDKIEKLRLEIYQQQEFLDFEETKKTPTLDIKKKKNK